MVLSDHNFSQWPFDVSFEHVERFYKRYLSVITDAISALTLQQINRPIWNYFIDMWQQTYFRLYSLQIGKYLCHLVPPYVWAVPRLQFTVTDRKYQNR